MDSSKTWKLIHSERSALADTLEGLSTDQWAKPALCAGWTVHDTAGHVLAAAEQNAPRFFAGMAASGFRFNAAIDKQARRLGRVPAGEIIARLRARTTTTNHPPGPVLAMLGEVVVHTEDIREPLGIKGPHDPDAAIACLDMFVKANFPVGTKKRIAGLRLVAADVGWAHGTGPEVTGPSRNLLLAMTGRRAGLDGLAGEGLGTLRTRMSAG